jgi:phosphoribosyl 1,2-cyclic phosphate phosphodiesterase
MKTKVNFLGTGTSQGVPVITCECQVCTSDNPKDARLRSSVFIEFGDTSIVIDTGPDFRQQMLRIRAKKLDAVLFTHEHKDHVAGLDDVRAFNFAQGKSMDVFCTEQVSMALKREFHYVFSNDKYPGIPRIDLNIFENKEFSINGTTIIPIEVFHYQLPVFGFRIGDFTYITDAKSISEKEKEKIKGSKVIVLNALRKHEHISHFTLDEAVDLMKEFNPEKGYFTHISHYLGLHDEVNTELPENMQLAYDGLELEC